MAREDKALTPNLVTHQPDNQSSRSGLPADTAPGASGERIAVVIPAYRVANQIEKVLSGIPDFVERIIVVEDAGPDDTAARVKRVTDPRVHLIRHDHNRGVGGAMKTGFADAIDSGMDIVVKMDGDDQMDPAAMGRLLVPIVSGRADMAKGNRYHDFKSLKRMPIERIIGNAGLTFLIKMASGYWNMFDPTNGYFAIRTDVLRRINLDRLPERYFFESGFLIQLGIVGAVVADVPIPARYGQELSSLSVTRTLCEFPPRLLWGMVRRIFWRYFVYDFSAVSVFLLTGLPLLVWGVRFGIKAWIQSARSGGAPATAGTVMLAAMPVIIGFQLLLQALVVDIQNVPRVPLSSLADRPSDPTGPQQQVANAGPDTESE